MLMTLSPFDALSSGCASTADAGVFKMTMIYRESSSARAPVPFSAGCLYAPDVMLCIDFVKVDCSGLRPLAIAAAIRIPGLTAIHAHDA